MVVLLVALVLNERQVGTGSCGLRILLGKGMLVEVSRLFILFLLKVCLCNLHVMLAHAVEVLVGVEIELADNVA